MSPFVMVLTVALSDTFSPCLSPTEMWAFTEGFVLLAPAFQTPRSVPDPGEHSVEVWMNQNEWRNRRQEQKTKGQQWRLFPGVLDWSWRRALSPSVMIRHVLCFPWKHGKLERRDCRRLKGGWCGRWGVSSRSSLMTFLFPLCSYTK